MVTDGQGTKWHRNIAENFNRLSRMHERYRRQTTDRQTDGRTTTYSEHEHEFTFAKKENSAFTSDNLLVYFSLTKPEILISGREE